MIHDAPLLKQQLATIEARGREHLRDAGRIEAQRHGLRVALLGLPVVPALAFALGWFVDLSVAAVVAAALLLAAISFGAVFLAIRGRHHLARRDALALFDRGFGLKDRLQAADEFLADAHPDGFRQAALREAAPWIARAQERSLAGPQGGALAGARRCWPAMAAALVLVGLMLVQQRFLPAAADGAQGADQEASPRHLARQVAAALHIDAPRGEGVTQDRAINPAGTRLETSPPGGLPGASHGARASFEQAGQAHAAAAAPAATGASGSAAASGSSATTAATGQAGRPGVSSARSAQSGSPDGAAQNPKANPSDARIGAERSGAADNRGARQSGSGHRNEGSSGQPSPSSSPLGAQRPNDSKGNNGQSQQQKRSDQSQPGQGQQSGQNKSDGNDSQGQRYGQDALKISRGSSAMLLAVPMEDRLGGMASPGMVDSVGRKASPHAGAAGQASAQDRGRALGDTGRLGHRPLTAEERRLMQDYFHPAAPAGR